MEIKSICYLLVFSTHIPTAFIYYARARCEKSTICIRTNRTRFFNVPEVLNVHVNESKKKSTSFRKIFFSKQWKINFWERKCDFLKYFKKFQCILLNWWLIFRKFRSYGRSELQVHGSSSGCWTRRHSVKICIFACLLYCAVTFKFLFFVHSCCFF